jgi:hypothetical protein
MLTDYGDLAEVTAATGSGKVEDGSNKFHSTFGSRPTALSDARLKTGIESVTNPLEGLKAL